MAMSRKDRFRLKSQLVDAPETDEWTFQKTNLSGLRLWVPEMWTWSVA